MKIECLVKERYQCDPKEVLDFDFEFVKNLVTCCSLVAL